MPLTLPGLDNRTYSDLVAEARAMIPALAPGWTDHNPADPGVTLIELFAWLTEMLLYRANEVTDANRTAFLRLINGKGSDWKPENLDEEIRETVRRLREPERAVTAADFERIALSAHTNVARARCVPQKVLTRKTLEERSAISPSDVSVVILASKQVDPSGREKVLNKVKEDLERARLLTTRLCVVESVWCKIAVKLTVVEPNIMVEKGPTEKGPATWSRPDVLDPSAIELRLTLHSREDMRGRILLKNAETALKTFLDPYKGGAQEKGWPFGGAIHLSQIYDLLARQPGVDHVDRTTWSDRTGKHTALAASESWRLSGSDSDLKTVGLEPHELPQAVLPAEDPKVPR